jgi:hypothetical protein
MYCAAAALIEAAKPITTKLMLARKTRPRPPQLSMLQEVSGRMMALLVRDHEACRAVRSTVRSVVCTEQGAPS